MSAMRSLQETVQRFILDRLSKTVQGYHATANFCCGGSIPIAGSVAGVGNMPNYGNIPNDGTIPAESAMAIDSRIALDGSIPNDDSVAIDGSTPVVGSEPNEGDQTTETDNIAITTFKSPPVVLRWDGKTGKPSGKLVFPIQAGQERVLEQLVSDCRTAEPNPDDSRSNRAPKAGILDTSEFSTNFSPYTCGIVDAIGQTLLPGSDVKSQFQNDNTSPEHWGIVAELVQLNVYPPVRPRAIDLYTYASNSFHDTPHTRSCFGTLVVSLPVQHLGGEMQVVYEEGEGMIYPLGDFTKGCDKIHWLAFYRNCHSYMRHVQTGNCITLTYRLSRSERLGGVLNPQFPTANPKLYPLYPFARGMLETLGFMKGGGTIGYHCRESYSHTNATAKERMPFGLKGTDAVILAVFHSLGLTVHVCPILVDDSGEGIHDWNREFEPHEITRLAPEFRSLIVDSGEEWGDDTHWYESHHLWGAYREFRKVEWLNGAEAVAEAKEYAVLHRAYMPDGGEDEKWIGHWYTSPAILIEVPPFDSRVLLD